MYLLVDDKYLNELCLYFGNCNTISLSKMYKIKDNPIEALLSVYYSIAKSLTAFKTNIISI